MYNLLFLTAVTSLAKSSIYADLGEDWIWRSAAFEPTGLAYFDREDISSVEKTTGTKTGNNCCPRHKTWFPVSSWSFFLWIKESFFSRGALSSQRLMAFSCRLKTSLSYGLVFYPSSNWDELGISHCFTACSFFTSSIFMFEGSLHTRIWPIPTCSTI